MIYTKNLIFYNIYGFYMVFFRVFVFQMKKKLNTYVTFIEKNINFAINKNKDKRPKA